LGPRDLDAGADEGKAEFWLPLPPAVLHVATSSVKDWSELIGRAMAGITPRGDVCVDAARPCDSTLPVGQISDFAIEPLPQRIIPAGGLTCWPAVDF